MQNVVKLVFRVLPVVLFLASCTDSKLHYLGYTYWGSGDPKVDYNNWGRDYSYYQNINYGVDYGPSFRTEKYDVYRTKSNNYGLFKKPTTILFGSRGFGEHEHRFLRDYKYAIFCPEGYVSEMDIRELEIKLHSITKRTLNRMIAPMNKEEFVYDTYSKKFCQNLSNAIKSKVMSITPGSQSGDLGGWQMFKPTDGLDDKGAPYDSQNPYRYKVTYMGDDWYKIYSPYSKGNDSVCVKVGFAGKFFNSKIIGLRNGKMGVDIYDTNYDTRFNNKMLTFTAFDDIVYTYMYMKFLCPKVYKMLGNKGIILHEDFPKAINKVVVREKAFVYEFYGKLLASGNDMRKIIKKYRYRMARYFAVSIDEQVKKKDYGVGMFLPCRFEDFATNGYTVDYVGEDCFKVTACGGSVFFKVVLYGNKMTPAIMGVKNPAQNVDYCPDRFPWPESIK